MGTSCSADRIPVPSQQFAAVPCDTTPTSSARNLANLRKSRQYSESRDDPHNLKVVGSNPTPATRFFCGINRLSAALRGGVCVSTARGSTVEARGCAVPRIGECGRMSIVVSHTRGSHLSLPSPSRDGPPEQRRIRARPLEVQSLARAKPPLRSEGVAINFILCAVGHDCRLLLASFRATKSSGGDSEVRPARRLGGRVKPRRGPPVIPAATDPDSRAGFPRRPANDST
jgi:hypothetical protein